MNCILIKKNVPNVAEYHAWRAVDGPLSCGWGSSSLWEKWHWRSVYWPNEAKVWPNEAKVCARLHEKLECCAIPCDTILKDHLMLQRPLPWHRRGFRMSRISA